MEEAASFRFLSMSPYYTARLKPGDKPKRIRAIRREIEVATIFDDDELLGGEVIIDRANNKVHLPNGEIWNLGGRSRRGRLRVVSYFLIWKEKDASTGYNAKCSPWIEELKNGAFEQIAFPWQELGTTVKFIPLHRKGGRRRSLGTAFWPSNRIEVYLQIWDKLLRVAHTVAHEIGHIVDWACVTNEYRARWRRARGFSQDYPWYGNPHRPDWKDPCGDFAECFAAWQVPKSSATTSRPLCDSTLDLLTELSRQQISI